MEIEDHKFWNTQPVPHNGEEGKEGPIDVIKTPEEIREQPYKLPSGFIWSDMDIANDDDAKEVYDLLLENYVEDDDSQFRFAYSVEMLRWSLMPPGYIKEYHIGVRNAKNKKLLGFITGTPLTVRIRDKVVKMVDVNYLCVHKKIRSKRLAPVLIKELTRRVNRHDGWQAVYTAGTCIPTPITKATYYHRSLDIKKLVDIGFARVPHRLTMAGYTKYLRLPNEFTIPGFRKATEKDMPQIYALLCDYLKQFTVAAVYSEEEARHYLTPRDDVIGCYVVENPTNHRITDFVSFFHIQSSIIGHGKYDTFTATYCNYYAATATDLKVLLENALIAAKMEKGDVFNALEIMNNSDVFSDLKFVRGDGTLHYYFYNWKLNEIKPSEMAVEIERKIRKENSTLYINNLVEKAPIKDQHAVVINPSALTRGQRKRLVNKTHVLAKKSMDVLSLLKNNDQKQRIESSIEDFSLDNKTEAKMKQTNKKKGAPKNQQKRNEMLFIEMQRYQNVITNDKVKEDPYAAVRQYLDARIQSQES